MLFLSLNPLKEQRANQLFQAKSVHTIRRKLSLKFGGETSYANYVFACAREKWRDIICTQMWGRDVSAIHTQNIPLNLSKDSKRGFIKRG